MTQASAARNLRLYPFYVAAVGTYAWLPVFFLFLASHVSVAQVLALEAIYYVTVVVLEVPSGYFSDRVGRRPALIVATSGLLLAYVVFALSTSFGWFAVAQVLLATGLAFNSGTDTSLHFGSLQAVGREGDYAERESQLNRLAFVVGALAAVLGGTVAMFDLRLAYAVSAVAALCGLLVAWSLVEPNRSEHRVNVDDVSFRTTLRICVNVARTSPLRWVFVVSVVATVINHLPYEFYQSYIEALAGSVWSDDQTPLLAGLHVAVVQLIAAPIAGRSANWAARFGLVRHLLASLGIQIVLIGLMALWLHPLVVVLLVFRSAPSAMQSAPIRAVIAPRIGPEARATYLSLQSLVGRLSFAVLLVILSVSAGSGADAIRRPLQVGLAVSGLLWIAVWLWRRDAKDL